MIKKIFKYLKNGTLFKKIKNKIKFKKLQKKQLSDKEYLIECGNIYLGYEMNLDNPKTFNEKNNWYKLHYKNPQMVDCVDKIRVREYVKEKGLEYILLNQYCVWNSFEEMNLDDMPNSFVLKTNHDSGGIIICRDKNNLSKKKLLKLKKAFNSKYCDVFREWPYGLVEKKIFAEELINTKENKSPNDYKFFCFNGEPKFLFVATDRDIDCKFDFFDTDWNHLDVKQGHENSLETIKKPSKLDEMLNICRILSKDFPHVRIDLYFENGNIYFGEMTFFHFGATTPFNPNEFDLKFGDFFDIESIKDSKYYVDGDK